MSSAIKTRDDEMSMSEVCIWSASNVPSTETVVIPGKRFHHTLAIHTHTRHLSAGSCQASRCSVETLPFPTQFTQWKPTLCRCAAAKDTEQPGAQQPHRVWIRLFRDFSIGNRDSSSPRGAFGPLHSPKNLPISHDKVQSLQ
jgi:hypothetical protein